MLSCGAPVDAKNHNFVLARGFSSFQKRKEENIKSGDEAGTSSARKW
jgi:hypothetical protein